VVRKFTDLCRNIQLNAQQSKNEFVTVMRNQVRWLSFGNEANLFEHYHPLRPIMRWWNDRKMRRYISHQLDLRFKSSGGNVAVATQDRDKTIVDLALDTYRNETAQGKPLDNLDTVFRDYAISQIRTFVFAGHDSTGSAMCYAFHLLSTNPSARRLLTSEHDRILGPDRDRAASEISANPHLLNQLPYTLAVVKETLRLYPPASSTRSGEPDFFVTGLNGRQLPTDGFLVWSNSYAIHRDPNLWLEPDKFVPERWLVEEGDRLYPRKGAFRPFEFGPRNCIGQELAMLELKLVLVMTVRGFEVKSVYDEWDKSNHINGTKTVNGDRAYQILSGAAHPSHGLPCRVSLAAH
jgi:cytochrome P450